MMWSWFALAGLVGYCVALWGSWILARAADDGRYQGGEVYDG